MSEEKKCYGAHDTGKHKGPEKESGPHATGKDVSSSASRRDNHPGKKAGKAEHEKLIADQRITAETRGAKESFPKKSTAAKKNVKK